MVVGDILDRASVAAALRGTRYLIHAAADYRLWAPSSDDLLRANVEGTRTVMEEALRAGLERIVYTSSVATFDLRAGGRLAHWGAGTVHFPRPDRARMAHLTFIAKERSAASFQLAGPALLGRSVDADVYVPDVFVSREHCRFEPTEDGGWAVVDTGSRNGIFFKGNRIARRLLQHGDRIEIGSAS